MNIVVTGSSRGLGFEIISLLAKENNHTILAISRSPISLSPTGQGTQLLHAIMDISDSSIIEQQLPVFLDSIGHIDILINNAGLLINRSFMDQSPEDWMNTFRVNLLGPVTLIRTTVPYMRSGSHIVNIGSMGGFMGSVKFKGLTSYSSSKAALANLTETLAVELEDKGIAVNCLALGSVDTEMLQKAFPDYRSPVSPRAMAGFIADFSRNANQVMNGKVIPVAISNP